VTQALAAGGVQVKGMGWDWDGTNGTVEHTPWELEGQTERKIQGLHNDLASPFRVSPVPVSMSVPLLAAAKHTKQQ
jgi:hypothetical protein